MLGWTVLHEERIGFVDSNAKGGESMREVTEFLLIGNVLDARNPKLLCAAEIEAVVDLAADEPPAFRMPRDMIYVRIPLVDGGANSAESLFVVVSTIASLLSAEIRTIVCCAAGLSRSPAVAAAALALATNQKLEAALLQVNPSGSCQVNSDVIESILEVFEQLR